MEYGRCETIHFGHGRPRKYAFDKMAVGGREFFPSNGGCMRKLQNTLITVANRYGRFRSRRVVSGGQAGVVVERFH